MSKYKYVVTEFSRVLISDGNKVLVHEELASKLKAGEKYIRGKDFEVYRESNPSWPLEPGVLIAIPNHYK